MMNEGQVSLQWQRLFANQIVTPENLQVADELIEQLRAESPLRFRLQQELREIRQIQGSGPAQAKPLKRKRSTR